MNYKNILITGGSGLIGSHLSQLLDNNGFNIKILSRHPEKIHSFPAFLWNPAKNFIDPAALKNTDIIIHLAGANIATKHWTNRRKQLIYSSRIHTANLLFENVKKLNIPLKAFISASAVGYYGTFNSNRILTENSEPGTDFLAKTAVDWEKAALQFRKLNIPVAIIRIGVVLAKNGGLLHKLLPLAKLGLLSSPGSGKQIVPWIHIADLTNLFLFIIQNQLFDTFNAVAPSVSTFNDLTRLLLKAYGHKQIMPNIPAPLIKLLFGQMSIIMLYGSEISSQKIINKGFLFKFKDLNSALKNLISP